MNARVSIKLKDDVIISNMLFFSLQHAKEFVEAAFKMSNYRAYIITYEEDGVTKAIISPHF